MADKISFECPGCGSKLSVTDRSKLERKIKCPKCKEIFQPEVPDQDLKSFDDEIENDPEEKPQHKQSTAAKGKNSAKSSGGGSRLPLIMGGGALVLILAGAGAYFSGVFGSNQAAAPTTLNPAPLANTNPVDPPSNVVSNPQPTTPAATQPIPAAVAPQAIKPTVVAKTASSPMTEAERALGLRWMPAETDFIIHAKASAIYEAALLKNVLNMPAVADAMKEIEKRLSVHPSQVESFTMGSAGFLGMMLRASQMATPQMGPHGDPPKPIPSPPSIVVVKTKTPVDFEKIRQGEPAAILKEKNGKSYIEFTPPFPNALTYGGWTPDSNTIVYGSLNEVLETIDRGETTAARPELHSIDHTPQLVIAMAINLPDQPSTPKSNSPAGPNPITNLKAVKENFGLDFVSIGINVRGGVDLQVSAASNTSDGAAKLKEAFDSAKKDAQEKFDANKDSLPPVFADLGSILLGAAKIDEANQKVILTTAIPDSEQSKLEEIPGIVMMMAMTSGLGGAGPGGNPFGSFPGFGPPESAGASKLPGSTAALSPKSVEDLPKGLSITARTAWGPLIYAGGKPTPTVEILIDITGEGVDKICAATSANPKVAKLASGASLKAAKLGDGTGVDSQKTLIPFDLQDQSHPELPPNTVRIQFFAEPVGDDATTIELYEGTFKILTANESRALKIDNVPQRAKRPLTEPEFKAGQVKLVRGESAIPETLRLFCAKTHYIGRAIGTPGDVMSVTEVEKSGIVQRIYCGEPNGKFKDNFEIRFKLYSDIKEHTIKFKFENLALPSLASKPNIPPPGSNRR